MSEDKMLDEMSRAKRELYEDNFSKRLSELRREKGVSARKMSLALGQNAGYINHIEKKQVMPSLLTFFNICEYLDMTPGEFFRDGQDELEPGKYFSVMQNLEELSPEQLGCIQYLIRELGIKNRY